MVGNMELEIPTYILNRYELDQICEFIPYGTLHNDTQQFCAISKRAYETSQ